MESEPKQFGSGCCLNCDFKFQLEEKVAEQANDSSKKEKSDPDLEQR